MIVDLLRNDLSRIAQLGTVRVPRLFELLALPTVWQMTSTVTAVSRDMSDFQTRDSADVAPMGLGYEHVTRSDLVTNATRWANEAVQKLSAKPVEVGRYDLILDAVGNRSVSAYRRALNPRGACVVVGFTTLSHLFGVISVGAWASRTGSQKVGLMGTAKPNTGDLVFIGGLLETGAVVPVIDKRYPLSETAEAIRYLEQGRARGKVVVSVKPSGHL